MKKKLLPYILGCAMVTAMPLVAHAETSYHSGTDIINEISANRGDLTDEANAALTDDGHNEFTEYNDTSTTNTRAKVFGTPSISGGAVSWAAGALGNTRELTSTMQESYPVTLKNEKQDLRKEAIEDDQVDPSTLAEDLANANFNDQTNDTQGVTDLETAVPVFDMTIPAKTVLPMGATHWRLGNVKIEGQYFVRPDKVNVTIDHEDFKHSDYDAEQSGWTDIQKAAHKIQFTVSDKRYTDAALTDSDNRYFFQDGAHTGANHETDTMQSAFPYAYTGYSSDRYEAGLVSEINETHQVWLNAASAQWAGKAAGKYTGSITFSAAVVTDDSSSMYGDRTSVNNPYYPGEGSEPNS